jgi:hypothetical protein
VKKNKLYRKKLSSQNTEINGFNTIEYGQRLRYYIPLLKEKGINNFKMIINSTPEAAKQLASFIALPG